ncbi:two-component system OmpR family sensor kinase [Okibacterium sp. HSC-33S16]|uniref:sensor histidine kinase n=1 Tax=Okibacterium sp. HSC-33S16 TaxID=2910965 RepID=UPI00209E6A75|nr:HAMP domain-containing sensor histidine kinase [Okibacterium sp. HSC-33S16]MCP2030177.1 two-component system OmpR family sensor kinase [Okibacterium sp. HSC-33S16]
MHDSVAEWWNAISLRTKITSVTVLVLAFGLIVAGVGTMTMLRPALEGKVNADLVAAAQAPTPPGFLDLDGEDDDDAGELVQEAVSSDYFTAVYDADGKLRAATWQNRDKSDLPIVPSTVTLSEALFQGEKVFELHTADKKELFHAVIVPYQWNHQGEMGVILVAVSMRETDTIIATLFTIFFGFGLGVIILGALLTRVLVMSAFHPLREVERTASAIADGDFSQRLAGSTPNTEVGRLNRSLNTMLARIDRAFADRARTIEQMRRFVGDASHELRTPLVSVRGYAELYRMGALQTPEDVAKAMDRIEKEAIRMGGLVEDLLELARLDETKPMVMAPVDLSPIARDAALDASASAPDRVVRAVVDNPPTAPLPPVEADKTPSKTVTKPQPAEEPPATGPIAFAGATLARLRRRPRRSDPTGVLLSGDLPVIQPSPLPEVPAIVLGEENKLRQVVTNLIGNAMRFTPAGSPLEIGVSANPLTHTATISVIDHGEGVPPQIREKIFQRFWRADSSRARETGGSGLGLAIVSSIVAAHNGTVSVTETPGGGATFRVTLPLYTPAPADESHEPEAQPAAAVEAPSNV